MDQQANKKTKILFVITKSNFGGAQKYVYDIATGLSPEHFEVTVASGGAGLLLDKLKAHNIRTITIPSLFRDISITKEFSSFRELYHLLKSERPDVVHLNSSKVGGIGALAGRSADIPRIIFTAHGWAWHEEHRSALQKITIKCASWATMMLSHTTIAVSKAVYDDTRHFPFVAKKIALIKNGIGAISFTEKHAARAHLFTQTGATIDDSIFLIGTVAELHKNKGLIYAVDAMKTLTTKYPHIRYVVMGSGEDRALLEARIKQHELQKHVFLLGFVDHASQNLSALDCFLLPSLKEGLPYVLLEAGQAKLPVVATEIGGIPDCIVNNTTGLLVPPHNPDAIAQAVERLVTTPELGAQLGNALSEKIQNEFSLENMREETEKLYLKNI